MTRRRARATSASRLACDVCALDEISPDTGVCALIGGRQVAIVRTGATRSTPSATSIPSARRSSSRAASSATRAASRRSPRPSSSRPSICAPGSAWTIPRSASPPTRSASSAGGSSCIANRAPENTMEHETIATVAAAARTKAGMLRHGPLQYLVLSALAGAYVGLGIVLIFAIGAPLAGRRLGRDQGGDGRLVRGGPHPGHLRRLGAVHREQPGHDRGSALAHGERRRR